MHIFCFCLLLEQLIVDFRKGSRKETLQKQLLQQEHISDVKVSSDAVKCPPNLKNMKSFVCTLTTGPLLEELTPVPL